MLLIFRRPFTCLIVMKCHYGVLYDPTLWPYMYGSLLKHYASCVLQLLLLGNVF